MAGKKIDQVTTIEPIKTETIVVPIVSLTPLIMSRFGETAIGVFRDLREGKKRQKIVRKPEEEFEECLHRLPDGNYGFPSVAFKEATVAAARLYQKSQITMVELRQLLFFFGELGQDRQMLVRIKKPDEFNSTWPVMREDRTGVPSLAYRPEFPEWRANLKISYVASSIDRSSVLSLIDAGGLTCGVGCWTALKKGEFGKYKVDESKKVEVVE